MSKVLKEVCLSLGIRGEGANNYVTTHGLRATTISLLISSGHSDAAVVLRSGHRDNNNLQSYHNLIGHNGEQQLAAGFGGTSDFVVGERGKTLCSASIRYQSFTVLEKSLLQVSCFLVKA